MTTVYCANCKGQFEGDRDHVRVGADIIHTDAKDEKEGFAFCSLQCWREATGDWIQPQ